MSIHYCKKNGPKIIFDLSVDPQNIPDMTTSQLIALAQSITKEELKLNTTPVIYIREEQK